MTSFHSTRASVFSALLQIGLCLVIPAGLAAQDSPNNVAPKSDAPSNGAPKNGAQKRGAPKNADNIVRVTADQLHQLNVVKVELYPFRQQRFAIGQIAYNEDTSTSVLAPFSGRVTGLIAKIGDRVKRGDPLFEIDSPEVVQPQNDYIAAVTALNKARSALDLARIVEKRLKDLYEGKAAPLKEWQAAEAALVAAQNDLRSGEITLEATRSRLRIVGFTDEEIAS